MPVSHVLPTWAANNAVQHFATPVFDEDIVVYYWRGWKRSHDPNAVILREVLLPFPITIIHRL